MECKQNRSGVYLETPICEKITLLEPYRGVLALFYVLLFLPTANFLIIYRSLIWKPPPHFGKKLNDSMILLSICEL